VTPLSLYAQQNANDDVTALINTSGQVQERYLYDPYGAVTITDANWNPRTGNTSNFGWQYLHQGGRLDSVTGWYGFRNRDLIPSEGKWAERDPLGLGAGDLNLYRYELNNSIGLSDPSALSPNKRDARGAWGRLLRNVREVGGGQPAASYGQLMSQLSNLAKKYSGYPKYIYTCKYRWIDTLHFFNSALPPALAGGDGLPGDLGAGLSLAGGLGVEVLQSFGYLTPWWPGIGSSAFTSEDLPSDLWGTAFGQGLGNGYRQRMSLEQQILDYFTKTLGGVCDPEKAPGFKSLPEDELEHQRQWQKGVYQLWLRGLLGV